MQIGSSVQISTGERRRNSPDKSVSSRQLKKSMSLLHNSLADMSVSGRQLKKSMSFHNNSPSASPRPQQTCTCSPSDHPGSFRCSRHKPVDPTKWPRRRHTSREILRRALSPSASGHRRWNFRPIPSRLCNMSMA
ncbi:uncharacterized protein LOC131242589 [Magnolia sinica]|uniref:uncharacterized protein LOC131242589 n=1 Tax=Magnolia sinica TaxID=86752 RepID=UPI002658B6CF|nr:uncharacterized protein LOC131242589 [Magnolia sinica]